MILWKAKTTIKTDFSFINSLIFRNHTDYDLVDAVDAIALKSLSGDIFDFYRNNPLENPDEYKYTKLYEKDVIKNLLDAFKLKKTRVRIHRQLPLKITKLHTDDQNTAVKVQEDMRLRIFTALNESKDFIYEFKSGDEFAIYNLKQGESIVFDPDEVEHGTKNLSDINSRFSLVQIVQPNEWLKSFIKNKNEIVI